MSVPLLVKSSCGCICFSIPIEGKHLVISACDDRGEFAWYFRDLYSKTFEYQ